VPGEIRHPKIWDAIMRCSEACAKNGIYCGTPGLGDPEYIQKLIANGVKFLSGPSDYGIVRSGLQAEVKKYQDMGFTFRKYDPKTA